MRCARCGKHFDEEMYNGICPKCGYFHSRQTEYDVNKYFSAKFGDEVKTSTDEQAAKQHAELHRMYDRYNMHRQQAKQAVPHQAQAANPYQQRGVQATANPYQQAAAQGNPYQTSHAGSWQPGNIKGGRIGSYQQRNSPQHPYGQVGADGKTKEKNIVPFVCAVASVAAVIITVVACYVKKMTLTESYTTLDYEQEYAGAGQIFEINDRMLIVEKAEVIDTSMLDDIPVHIPGGDKLVGVSVEVLPTEEWDRSWTQSTVYLSDGITCRQELSVYTLGDILIREPSSAGGYSYYETDNIIEELFSTEGYSEEEILTGYNYLDYDSVDGKAGRFYFLADKDAETVTISFDQERGENGVSVLKKRVSVALDLEEEAP